MSFLKVTPWGSPRLLSPVDVRHIVPEQGELEKRKYSPSGSPSRQRWSPRASFSRKVSHRVCFIHVVTETKMTIQINIFLLPFIGGF